WALELDAAFPMKRFNKLNFYTFFSAKKLGNAPKAFANALDARILVELLYFPNNKKSNLI
ncbi:hypothetical protein, partial [Oceanobacillus caeni]|uniref:hypothetical protein n=1 Tax=Oceanobacillus caeni TaxID=405946 RepID=UPI002E216174|nr:hypothetical protein [Oceanobacillus caeni]